MPFGTLDTRFIDFPAGVDEAYLRGLKTRAGVSFEMLLREIDSRLAALNGSVDPLVASLIVPTTEITAEDVAAVAFEIQEQSEFTIARPQLAEGIAHMLPLRKWDVATQFTEEGLEGVRITSLLNQVDSILLGYRALYRKQTLKRLFDNSEVRVDKKTTATSPGFAGSGTGTNVFSRPYPDGTALPGGYTHYARVASDAASLKAGIKAGLNYMKKWHTGPFDLIANQTMIDAIVAFGSPDFVTAGSALVRPASGVAEALVDPSKYVGVLFGEIRVQAAVTDYSEDYISLFKSYGNLHPQNPLAWRYDELVGRNAFLRYRALYPLDQATVIQRFGVGVNNRVGAYLLRVAASGSYSAPTTL
jgi:hypothetical protein